jgi:hypothetical protein
MGLMIDIWPSSDCIISWTQLTLRGQARILCSCERANVYISLNVKCFECRFFVVVRLKLIVANKASV